MFYALATISFFLVFAKYISWEFNKNVDLKKHYGWLIAAGIVSVLAVTTSYYMDSRAGNFAQHAVGGGVAVALGFIYLKKQFNATYNWRIEIILLFGLVSALGCINELAEFAADNLGYGIFSFDRQDTWRDIAANSLGAVLAYVLIKVCYGFLFKKKL